jgi:uncharacterized protein
VAVSPAVMRLDRLDVSDALTRSCPWLVVQGDADEVLDAAAVLKWASKVSPEPEVRVLQGASHFFHGRLHDLRNDVLAFMRRDSAG